MVLRERAAGQLRLWLDQPTERERTNGDFDVEATLAQLLTQDLTFAGQRTTYATHNVHAFAAKFPPQLPRLFIHELTSPGERVLDPMSGSGTMLVEAVLAGRQAIGIDLDPLAALIGHIKSTPRDLGHCQEIGSAVVRKARMRKNATPPKLERFYSPRAIGFFQYWFEEHTTAELFALIRAIRSVRESDVRALLEVVFSSSIITKTGSLTRARDLGHSRPHRDLHKKVTQSAFDVFEERLRTTLQALTTIQGVAGHAAVARGDARALPLPNDSVHLVVTSPPYAANAIDYMRAHKFSLMWLGYPPEQLTDLRGRYIGAELQAPSLTLASKMATRVLAQLHAKDPRRASVVAYYYHDVASMLKEILRVLVPGRAAVIVVGSSVIQGVEIHVPQVVAELAESVGFKLAGVAVRQIVRNARMMPVSHKSDRNGIEARMHEEGVIGLTKPL